MEKRKSILFLCECGNNVSDFVDLPSISEWAGTKGEFAAVETHRLLCSPDGVKTFKQIITEKKPDSIIVAACSPKLHEKTFQDAAEEAGFNISQIQMANIREQCGWVTKDKDKATEKARVLIRAALQRSYYSEPLEKQSMEVLSDIAIIGGGIAGIEAALTASKAGRKVYIIDREISLGGSVIRTEEVGPNMECAPCLLAPILSEVREDPNITVVTNADVEDVLGFYGNFKVRGTKKPRYVEESCMGCEACFEVCPVEADREFHLNMGKRKAIYTQFPGSVPMAAVIDKEICKHFTDGSCDACAPICPFESINFNEKEEKFEFEVGSVILATGFSTLDLKDFSLLGYGTIENVYTSEEFELLSCSSGPTGGSIQMKNGEKPQSIAVIHCAGSLRDDGVPYCSGICCMTAIKVGDLIRKQVAEAKVYNIHKDLVFQGTRQHEFYRHQKKEGTQFLFCEDLKSVEVKSEGAKIKVSAKGIEPLTADMVVLPAGLKPAKGTEELAKKLNIDREKSGFFKPGHELLHETSSTLEGVYIAGCAAGPCDVSTAVTRARAAAGDSVASLVPGKKIELEVMTSVIDEEKCGGCKFCLTVCPYKAITFDAEKTICVVNEALCKGCGTCTATCGSGASKAKHFTDEQIYAEIGGLLNE